MFLRYLKEYLYRILDEHINVNDTIPHDYAMDISVSSFAETVRWWLKDHSEYTPEQITEYLYDCISIL
jgi:transcriptional regulator, TetR family